MQFNAFVWELYKESERGQGVLERWSRFRNTGENGNFDENGATVVKAARDYAGKFEVNSLEEASTAFEGLVRSGLSVVWPDSPSSTDILDIKGITDFIREVSAGLFLAHPDYFIPYSFTTEFDMLLRVSEAFGLPLPPTPGKRDRVGRALLYGYINEAFHEFRKRHNLSVVEMCAFLYDFVFPFVVEDDKSELPAPSKVWPIIAGAYNSSDFEWIEAATWDSVSSWNGNPNVRRGDVLVMYSVTPHKCIHSVWRALTDGFSDPFSYYYTTVWVG